MTTRIQRYELLLSELLDAMPADHGDRAALAESLDAVRLVMRRTNDLALQRRVVQHLRAAAASAATSASSPA